MPSPCRPERLIRLAISPAGERRIERAGRVVQRHVADNDSKLARNYLHVGSGSEGVEAGRG